MAKYILILLLLLWHLAILSAQHCPFDGKSIVLVKIMGPHKLISNLRLEELENPLADSCSFAEGLNKMTFQPIRSIYKENHWYKTYERKFRKLKLTRKGDYFVDMGMAYKSCMLKRGSEYQYVPREYVIKYENTKTKRTETVSVPLEKIYSLCTAKGSWERIDAVTLIVNNP